MPTIFLKHYQLNETDKGCFFFFTCMTTNSPQHPNLFALHEEKNIETFFQLADRQCAATVQRGCKGDVGVENVYRYTVVETCREFDLHSMPKL